MPIITGSLELDVRSGVRGVLLEGLPEFNGADPQFRINDFTGLDDAAQPRAVLVANGGGPGAVDVDSWEPAEAYYQISGRIWAGDVRDRAPYRRLLLAALPADRVVPVVILGRDLDVDLQVFVRRYDKPLFTIGNGLVTFAVPLVAPDPYKYALETLEESAGGFVPEDWYRVYSEDAGDWYRTYTDDTGTAAHYRTYQEADADASIPTSIVMQSPGDAPSDRVTITVTGPVTAGDWWVEGTDGTRLWADVTLAPGQSVTFDSLTRSATLGGSPVDHLVFGDYLQLKPGENVYRLILGSPSPGASVTVQALPAYQ